MKSIEQKQLTKNYYAGVKASIRKKWWLYLFILFLSVTIPEVSKLPGPERLIFPIIGGPLIGFLILKDNTKALKNLSAGYKKDKKRNTKRMIFAFVLFFILGYAATFIAIKTNNNNTTSSSKKSSALKITLRNNYISTCKKGPSRTYITDQQNQNYCTCVVDYLISTVGERVYSDEYHAETAKNGLGQQLTDGIAAKCSIYLK